MPMSWASVASTPPPPPTPKDRWDSLIATYAAKPLRLVLLDVLGLLETSLVGQDSPAAPLVEHCVVVAVDTEAWTANTDEMTEIGLVIAEHKDGKELRHDVGDYAENVLKKMKYHHLRIWENAHLKTSADWMRGADGNRFGQSRFVTFAEARDVLDTILRQPIVSTNPDVAGLKRPVILLGHALAHDKDNVMRNGLHYDFRKHGTVVKDIDTQKLVKEVTAWVDKKSPGNDIGLDKLCEEVFDFAHDDAHTALNDAARTFICAVNLALRNWKLTDKIEKTMQEVAHEIEQYSQDNFSSPWGTELMCTRCGGRDHSNKKDQCTAAVYCKACERFDETTLEADELTKTAHMNSHIEQFCTHVAEFGGWKRRVYDADRKHNPLPPGPPSGSHPRSTWRGKWPMESPIDGLVPEPREVRKPMQSLSVDLPATSARPADVKVVAFQSTGRARAEKEKRVKKMGVENVGGAVKVVDDAWDGNAW